MPRIFPPTIERLMANVIQVPTGGCWAFMGATTWDGYGRIRHKGKTKVAHDVAFEIFVGPIPDGMMVLHSCDNRCCVNPHHLRVGTHGENMRDMTIRKRAARPNGVKNGASKLSDDAVKSIRDTYNNGGISQRALARRFGVCQQLVSGIVRNEYWPHI